MFNDDEGNTMNRTLIVKTSEICEGDVVLAHGLRCLIDGHMRVSENHTKTGPGGACHYYKALVLNRDDVSNGHVPRSWTDERDGTHRWTIQGNDLARWVIEARPETNR